MNLINCRNDPYTDLQIAIVEKAFIDYVTATLEYNRAEKRSIARFFNSKWGDTLCEGNGKQLLKKTKEISQLVNNSVTVITGKYCKKFITDIPYTKENKKALNEQGLNFENLNGYYATTSVQKLIIAVRIIKGAMI